MNEVEPIIEQMKATFDGSAWHGPSFTDTLKGVDVAQAVARPIEGRHTIWELVNHSAFWIDAVTAVLEGGEMPKLGEVNDWPLIGEGEAEWARAIEELKRAHNALVESLEVFNEPGLREAVPGQKFTYSAMLHGVVHHNLYHAGQIAILKEKA